MKKRTREDEIELSKKVLDCKECEMEEYPYDKRLLGDSKQKDEELKKIISDVFKNMEHEKDGEFKIFTINKKFFVFHNLHII